MVRMYIVSFISILTLRSKKVRNTNPTQENLQTVVLRRYIYIPKRTLEVDLQLNEMDQEISSFSPQEVQAITMAKIEELSHQRYSHFGNHV
jgi:hypothetical protein